MDSKFFVWFLITLGFVWIGVGVIFKVLTNANHIKIVFTLIVTSLIASLLDYGTKIHR